MENSQKISKNIFKGPIYFELYYNDYDKGRKNSALMQFSILLCYKKPLRIFLAFCITELRHCGVVALINFTWLCSSTSNISPLFFGNNFLMSNTWCFNTVDQGCKYNFIKIHPKVKQKMYYSHVVWDFPALRFKEKSQPPTWNNEPWSSIWFRGGGGKVTERW